MCTKGNVDCAHVIHSHLSDETTVRFFPFDSTNTIHRKTQEHCSEEIIIHRLKQYITEFKDSIYKCEEQLETYTCHLHSSIQISHIGELVIDWRFKPSKLVLPSWNSSILLACLPDRQTLERDSCNGRFGVGRQLPQVWKTQLWTSGIPLYWLYHPAQVRYWWS